MRKPSTAGNDMILRRMPSGAAISTMALVISAQQQQGDKLGQYPLARHN
jgi:hypothetical protein